MTVALTPLDPWIRRKIGVGPERSVPAFAEALSAYQLRKANETLAHARANSPFYGAHLEGVAQPIRSLEELARVPFTAAEDLSREPSTFLAVPQDEVARIVTLRTSGTTGEGKRLFFTEDDLELTLDFFHHGMSTLVSPGGKVMVFLPGAQPDSVGDLLVRALARMDVEAAAHGTVSDGSEAAAALDSFGADALVGIPTQVLGVARSPQGAAIGKGRIRSVLLSTDYVPGAIVRALEEVWGCRVFNHYGMTETGLGGGVECEALAGYHLREADLHFEIVDRETGDPCPDGVVGEVVFTTLTRRGTPLIRYRTGDIARMLPAPCPCGTSLRRMERVRGRWEGVVSLGQGNTLALPDLDEALFQLPGLLDYRVTLSPSAAKPSGVQFDVHKDPDSGLREQHVLQALLEVPALRMGIAAGYLKPPVVRFSGEQRWTTTGVAKRRIEIEAS